MTGLRVYRMSHGHPKNERLCICTLLDTVPLTFLCVQVYMTLCVLTGTCVNYCMIMILTVNISQLLHSHWQYLQLIQFELFIVCVAIN